MIWRRASTHGISSYICPVSSPTASSPRNPQEHPGIPPISPRTTAAYHHSHPWGSSLLPLLSASLSWWSCTLNILKWTTPTSQRRPLVSLISASSRFASPSPNVPMGEQCGAGCCPPYIVHSTLLCCHWAIGCGSMLMNLVPLSDRNSFSLGVE